MWGNPQLRSPDKPNSDVTSLEIIFCQCPVGKKAWFSSVGLSDPPQCRQGNVGTLRAGLGAQQAGQCGYPRAGWVNSCDPPHRGVFLGSLVLNTWVSPDH